jgi:hypothetical protein
MLKPLAIVIALLAASLASAQPAPKKKAIGKPPKAPKFAGLTALAARKGMRPAACNPKEGERAIYTDPVTGHQVWRMTDHPAIDRHDYYDILAWNANGSQMMFLSRRAGGGRMLMKADGTDIRPVPKASDGARNRCLYWSPTEPNVLISYRTDDKSSRVVAIDAKTGKVRDIASIPFGGKVGARLLSSMEPPHPDGRFFLFRYGGMDKMKTLLIVVDAETKKLYKIEVGMSTHRVRWTKHPSHTIFVNCNFDLENPKKKKRTQWLINLDGSKRQLAGGGGHPDWSSDGMWLGYFANKGIDLVHHDTNELKTLLKTGAGGHGGFSISSGRYHVADAPKRGPYGNMIFVTEIATGKPTLISYHGSSYSGWKSGVPDPEATHPSPICSPDETKIVYDSDLLGQPDVWVAVWKLPGKPRDVVYKKGVLSWKPPELHKEIEGYNVYRLTGADWFLVKSMVKGMTVDMPAGSYAVSAREHSGLESPPAVADSRSVALDSTAPFTPKQPILAKVGPRHLVITWPEVKTSDLAHYNVYAAKNAPAKPSNATLVGSPKVARFVDWGLKGDTEYHYVVTAIDSRGNESAPSPVVAGKCTFSASTAKVTIVIDASEAKVTKPMIHGKDAKAGESIVSVPEEFTDQPYAYGGKAAFTFDVPEDGTYDFYALVYGPDGGSNSFLVSVGDIRPVMWGFGIRAQTKAKRFRWLKVGGMESTLLKKGKHTLVVGSREDGALLSKVIITNQISPKFPK